MGRLRFEEPPLIQVRESPDLLFIVVWSRRVPLVSLLFLLSIRNQAWGCSSVQTRHILILLDEAGSTGHNNILFVILGVCVDILNNKGFCLDVLDGVCLGYCDLIVLERVHSKADSLVSTLVCDSCWFIEQRFFKRFVLSLWLGFIN